MSQFIAPIVLQRQLLPTVDALEAEFWWNKTSVRETLTTLFHRLHEAKRLRDPQGRRFPDVATAVNLVVLPPRGLGTDPTFNPGTYQQIVNQSSTKSPKSPEHRGAGPIKAEDWKLLQPVVTEAIKIAASCGDPKLIEAVFGPITDPSAPMWTFASIAQRLSGFSQANFKVNYDSTSDATGAAGASAPGSGVIELSGSLVKDVGTKWRAVISTLVHEAAHETNAKIIDLGYSGSAGFDQMLVADKLNNADHYAEIARRILGTSKYGDRPFTPKSGVLAGSTLKDQVTKNAKNANDGLEKLWSFSLDVPDTLLPRLVPGIDSETGKPAGRADTPEKTEERRELSTQVKQAYGLPLTGRPFVMTAIDRMLIASATMVLKRAIAKLARVTSTNDPALLERFANYQDPVDFASAAIWNVGGFVAERGASNARHVNLVGLYHSVHSKWPYR